MRSIGRSILLMPFACGTQAISELIDFSSYFSLGIVWNLSD